MNKIIVAGASGYIGKPLLIQAKQTLPSIGASSNNKDLIKLDLEHPGKFDYNFINFSDVIIFTAAISSPDICSREHDRAWCRIAIRWVQELFGME
jgi:dTDP-4-dehydrorhamnose reductase